LGSSDMFNQASIALSLCRIVLIMGRKPLEHGGGGRCAEGPVAWLATADWVSRRAQGPEIHEARNLLKRAPRGIRLWSLVGHDKVTRTGYLAELLSNQWLESIRSLRT